jgi:hypothetical protein
MTRTFKATFTWTDGHVDIIRFIYAPEHTKEISADDFKVLNAALVGTKISTWSQAEKERIDDPITDSAYVTSHGGDATLTSFVEE